MSGAPERRHRRASRTAAVLIATVLATAQTAVGDEGPVVGEDGVLTQAALAAVLESRGAPIQPLGGGAYEVVAGASGQCSIRVSLSMDERTLWLFAYMGRVPDEGHLSAAPLVALLRANDHHGPAYFSIADDEGKPRWLFLNRPYGNRGWTQASVWTAVEDFCGIVDAILQGWAGRK